MLIIIWDRVHTCYNHGNEINCIGYFMRVMTVKSRQDFLSIYKGSDSPVAHTSTSLTARVRRFEPTWQVYNNTINITRSYIMKYSCSRRVNISLFCAQVPIRVAKNVPTYLSQLRRKQAASPSLCAQSRQWCSQRWKEN